MTGPVPELRRGAEERDGEGVLILVRIDLSCADLSLFEAYEARVLALLPGHGGRLEWRLRAADGQSEVHLIAFVEAGGLDAFRADPIRLAAQELWSRSGAVAEVVEMERLV